MLRTNISEILSVTKVQPDKAVYVIKHNYEPRDNIKYLNTVQYRCPRKNWSSVALWNCAHPANKKVTADFVNTATPMELHRFQWLEDNQISEIDILWNWLVSEYNQPSTDVKNVHWAVGGPYFEEYKNADFESE